MFDADTSLPSIDLRISPDRQNGSHFRPQRCAQRHQQRREGRQAPGHDPPQLQGHRQVLERHAEARYVDIPGLTEERSCSDFTEAKLSLSLTLNNIRVDN